MTDKNENINNFSPNLYSEFEDEDYFEALELEEKKKNMTKEEYEKALLVLRGRENMIGDV